MKKQKGFTALELGIVSVILCIVFFGLVPWVWNATKLTSCDFEPDYKCEIVHGIGVIVPPTALITMWVGTDSDSKED